MVTAKQAHNEISVSLMDYRAAAGRNTGVQVAKDRLKNILFNHRDIILSALLSATIKEKKELTIAQREKEIEKKYARQVKELTSELETVDDENMAMRRKVRQLEAQLNDSKAEIQKLTAKSTKTSSSLSDAIVEKAMAVAEADLAKKQAQDAKAALEEMSAKLAEAERLVQEAQAPKKRKSRSKGKNVTVEEADTKMMTAVVE